jgi:hypothetical protein
VCEDADVMLRGHPWPRRSARPMSASRSSHGELRCNYTYSRPPPHRWDRLFCLGVSAQWRVHCPQARSGSETHDLYAHNVKAAFGAVRGGVEQGGGPPSARWGGPSPSGKQRARTPPSRGVPHRGRRGDRGPCPGRCNQPVSSSVPVVCLNLQRRRHVSMAPVSYWKIAENTRFVTGNSSLFSGLFHFSVNLLSVYWLRVFK